MAFDGTNIWTLGYDNATGTVSQVEIVNATTGENYGAFLFGPPINFPTVGFEQISYDGIGSMWVTNYQSTLYKLIALRSVLADLTMISSDRQISQCFTNPRVLARNVGPFRWSTYRINEWLLNIDANAMVPRYSVMGATVPPEGPRSARRSS